MSKKKAKHWKRIIWIHLHHEITFVQEFSVDQDKSNRTDSKDRIIRYLASIICLAVAVYSFWTTRDLVAFMVLIGVATGQVGIWEAIEWSGRHTQAGNITTQENNQAGKREAKKKK